MTTTLEATEVTLRPGYEGANIRTWVGFKHFMYLAEAAVLAWFRERDLGPSRLYHEYGLGLSIVDSSVLLPAVLDVDDEVRAEVVPGRPGRFTVRLKVHREGADVTVLRGRLSAALVRDGGTGEAVPEPLRPLVVDAIAAEPEDGPAPDGGFAWSFRAPYFHCHYSERLAHSAYVRTLEEVVDRFLADRGLSVGRMLAERAWIPVVSRARVRLLADARMEETVHTRFAVEDVHLGTTYDARMDCHVERAGQRVPVATARIQHGYAISRGPRAGQLAELDAATLRALTGVDR
ncbi:MAG TPA: thioesterase family protein [Rugosimonospora sp.]|nr:thioesterase family protein [Rugosimonospora sp.]